MTGGMISCRSDENRDERCIYEEREWEVTVSAVASFFCERYCTR